MSLGNLTTNLIAQLDNPECSYLSGIIMGSGFTMFSITKLFFIYLGFRIITDLLKLGLEWAYKKLKLRKSAKESERK